jgi:hypothetical protein
LGLGPWVLGFALGFWEHQRPKTQDQIGNRQLESGNVSVADSLQRVARVLPQHHNQTENSMVFSGTEVAAPFCIGDFQII